MATLLEKYSNRIKVAESFYSKQHNGEKMDNQRKLITARCLDNVNRFLTEAFDNSVGTQRSDLGMWKRFCLNLSNVVVPNLIAPELVLVQPMSSMSGYISYINYVSGSTKGGVKQGDLFNGVFGIGDMTEGRREFTSSSVTETFTATASQTDFVLAWYPIGEVAHVYDNNVETTEFTVDKAAHTLKLNTGATSGHTIKVAYTYDNVYIPQNDVPLLNAKVESIALVAKARRIAVKNCAA